MADRPLHLRTIALILLFLAELALIIHGASYGRGLYHHVMAVTGLPGLGLHLLAFAILTITALLIWKPSLKLLGGMVLIAIGLEIGQMFLPHRDAYVSDAAASVSGVFIGWMTVVGMDLLRARIKKKAARSSPP